MSRVVAPFTPHHVTQRGNRRQTTFFRDADYLRYLQLAVEWCAKAGVECWGYCLMPNHVHLILTPHTAAGLRKALAPLHWRYSYEINRRERWTGYLWQGRFASYPMDDAYFVEASRYVGLNPVRAGLVERAEDWPWSSVRAHIAGRDDPLVRTAPLRRYAPTDLADFFGTDVGEDARRKLRHAAATGRPLGGAEWLKQIEKAAGRSLAAPKRGRPRASSGDTHPFRADNTAGSDAQATRKECVSP
jgi:putative transposase